MDHSGIVKRQKHCGLARQRGLSFTGFMLGCFVLVLVSILGMKMIPLYIEDGEIQNTFQVIAHDPDMSKASNYEIRASFSKRASINNINVIKAEDIDISRESGTLVLSAHYPIKVALVGNVSLLLEFNPSSASK